MTSLEGVKVLDLTRMHAGPFAAMVLGDLGADVVKIEPPTGDASRSTTQYSYGPQSAFFVASNRNKSAVVLDLKSPADRDQLDRLLVQADLIIDNFRPGTLRRLGLHHDDISKLNQRLVSVSVTGYGENTPSSELPAYDLLAQAQGGVMSLTGESTGPPVKCGVPIGDLLAGVYAALGAIAALHEREITGLGQRVEVAMLDAQIAFLHYHFTYYDVAGRRLPRTGSEHHNMVPYGLFRCTDGMLALAVVSDPPKFWKAFCAALGKPQWSDDERYATGKARVEHREELRAEIERVLKTATRAEWLEKLRAAGVPAAPMNEIDELEHDPQVEARRMIVEMSTPYGSIRVPGNPLKMRGALEEEQWRPPPLLPENHQELKAVIQRWGSSANEEDSNEPVESFSSAHLKVSDGGRTAVLRGWRCADCHSLAFGIRRLCPVCGSKAGTESALHPRGRLETWSRVISGAEAYFIGYALITDDVGDQEIRVFGPLELSPDAEDSLSIGMDIEISFRQITTTHGKKRLEYVLVPRSNQPREGILAGTVTEGSKK